MLGLPAPQVSLALHNVVNAGRLPTVPFKSTGSSVCGFTVHPTLQKSTLTNTQMCLPVVNQVPPALTERMARQVRDL